MDRCRVHLWANGVGRPLPCWFCSPEYKRSRLRERFWSAFRAQPLRWPLVSFGALAVAIYELRQAVRALEAGEVGGAGEVVAAWKRADPILREVAGALRAGADLGELVELLVVEVLAGERRGEKRALGTVASMREAA